jgi:hypothetical protein
MDTRQHALLPHYRVTFTRGPGARVEFEVPATNPDAACALGRAGLLLAMKGDAEAFADWAVVTVQRVPMPVTRTGP